MDYRLLKKSLIEQCKAELEERLHKLEQELIALQEAASNETKSSMGDKYETGREMIMQERGKLEDQKSQVTKQQAFLHAIDATKHYKVVEFGSLVVASGNIYFISIPMGRVKINDKSVFVISANSPIGQAMLGKQSGDKCFFNGKALVIEEIA